MIDEDAPKGNGRPAKFGRWYPLVLRRKDITPVAKLVYQAIDYLAWCEGGGEDACGASNAALEAETGCGVTAVKDALRALAGLGLIVVHGGRGIDRRIEVVFPAEGRKAPSKRPESALIEGRKAPSKRPESALHPSYRLKDGSEEGVDHTKPNPREKPSGPVRPGGNPVSSVQGEQSPERPLEAPRSDSGRQDVISMPEAAASPAEATPGTAIDPLGEPSGRLKRYMANPDLAVCLELAGPLRHMQDTLADEIEGDADRLGTRCGSLAVLAQGLAEIDPRSKKPPRNCLSVAIAKAVEIRAGKKVPSPVGAKRFAAATSQAASPIGRRKLLKATLDEMPGAADFFRRILVELPVLHPSFLHRLELSDIDPDVFDGDWDGFFDVLRQAVAKAEEAGDVNAGEVIDGVIDRAYAKPEDWKIVVRRLGDGAATLIREIERDAPRFTNECGSRILEIHEACGGRFWAFSRSLRDAASIAKVSGETDVKVIVSNAVSATPAAAKSNPIEYVVCKDPELLLPPALRGEAVKSLASDQTDNPALPRLARPTYDDVLDRLNCNDANAVNAGARVTTETNHVGEKKCHRSL